MAVGGLSVAGHSIAFRGGIDVLAEPDRVRQVIGASGQYAAVDEHLTGRENLEMVGRLYHLGAAQARARAAEPLAEFDPMVTGLLGPAAMLLVFVPPTMSRFRQASSR